MPQVRPAVGTHDLGAMAVCIAHSFYGSGDFLIKAGQPQPEWNLALDMYKGVPHCRHVYTPSSKKSLYSPVNGGSVFLSRITCASAEVNGLIFISKLPF
jgi:hypothetical protein